MNHNVRRYRSKLKKKLHCMRKTQCKLLGEFDCMLNGFIDENPDASFDDLCSAFGPPEEMARILMEKLSTEDNRQHRRYIRIKRIVAAFCAVAFLLFVAYVFVEKQKPLTFNDNDELVDVSIVKEGE